MLQPHYANQGLGESLERFDSSDATNNTMERTMEIGQDADIEELDDDYNKMIGELLPCFKCERSITETIGPYGHDGVDKNGEKGQWNVPYEATQFTTIGHYGSTFWDSFEGERIFINICDECCKKHIQSMSFRRQIDYNRSIEFTPDEYKELYDRKQQKGK